MIRRGLAAVSLLCMLAACGRDVAAPLSAADVRVFAPLPGQPTGVAYFSLLNHTSSAAVLHEVSSPDFASVAMHTTMVEDDVSHMVPLDLLTIAERSQVEFTPGGPHLMLMQPRAGLAPGDEVTLEFRFDLTDPGDGGADGVLLVQATVLSRSR